MTQDETRKYHIPVLLTQVLNILQAHAGMDYFDGTIGFGGHFEQIYLKANREGNFFGFDQDLFAFNHCLQLFKNDLNVHLYHANYAKIDEYLPMQKFDAILLDLGVSSYELDEQDRGFSYLKDAKLDMRMNQDQELDAYQVINFAPQDVLFFIFKTYGECKQAKALSQLIVKTRKDHLIKSTLELADLIYQVEFSHDLVRKNPCKPYFQALRIYVNDELNVLKKAIPILANKLKPHGRLAIITFHSLEDKIVKQEFYKLCNEDIVYKKIPMDVKVDYTLITKKPIVADENEVANNHRSRSAQLRVIERR